MPKRSTAPPSCAEMPQKANVRIVRGFSSLVGGQDRPRRLEGRRGRTCAWGSVAREGKREFGKKAECDVGRTAGVR